MDRYARRQHFERLCSLRDGYGHRGALDSMSVISVDDVIAYAIDLLERVEAPSVTDDATDRGAAAEK